MKRKYFYRAKARVTVSPPGVFSSPENTDSNSDLVSGNNFHPVNNLPSLICILRPFCVASLATDRSVAIAISVAPSDAAVGEFFFGTWPGSLVMVVSHATCTLPRSGLVSKEGQETSRGMNKKRVQMRVKRPAALPLSLYFFSPSSSLPSLLSPRLRLSFTYSF